MKIKEVLNIGIEKLKYGKVCEPNLKAKLLLMFYLNCSKEDIIIYEDSEIEKDVYDSFLLGITQLLKGKPIQYITNAQEFMGLKFYVDENVLIPRCDTEILIEEIINIVKTLKEDIKILDLCTGSGNICVSLAKYLNNVDIYASDISENVLEIAKRNAKNHNVNITFSQSDLFEKINEKFNIIISNPPYIETDIINTLSEEVKKEPVLALDGGPDGLDFYRKIAKQSRNYLTENGIIALEIGYNQKEIVIDIFKNEGYRNIYSKKDLSGNDRIVICEI